MREILYRGKAINRDKGFHRTSYKNGDWVYGLVTRLFDERFENLPAEMTNVDGTSGIEVDYNTISQFTTLTDRNGKKIFEGDIVKTQEMYDRPYSKNRKSKRHIGVVKYQIRSGNRFYNAETGKWDRHIDYGAEWIVEVKDYGEFIHSSWGDFWDCEVIGNIHDNPELLRGDKNEYVYGE